MSRGGARFGKNPNLLTGATWEQDPNFKLDVKPSELFPEVPDLPPPRALTLEEKRIIRNSKALRETIQEGPLYTESQKPNPFEPKRVFGDEQRNAKYGPNSRTKTIVNPFEAGVPTYSLKYTRTTRTIPQLSGRPFCTELFPAELHDTLEGKNPGQRKRKLMLALTPAEKIEEEERRRKRLEERIEKFAEEEVEEVAREGADVTAEEEEADDAFSEDEADEGGDYDAENYFDDGASDRSEGEGGGDYE